MQKNCILLTLFITLVCTAIVSAQNGWSDPIIISDGLSPDFDLDRNTGHLHIASMVDGVLYTETDETGNILLQEYVPYTGTDRGGITFGATIAVDNEGYPHVCYREPNDAFTFSIFYTRKTSGGWTNPIRLSATEYRGYMVRMAIDGNSRAHIAWGKAVNSIWGPVTHVRIENGRFTLRQENIAAPEQYRADDRVEIDVTEEGIVHLLIGCPNPTHGTVTYYRSGSVEGNLENWGDIHSGDCPGRNGSPDVFVDLSGNTHICYGTQIDNAIGGLPSIRYIRWEGNTLVRHVPATQMGWLQSWKEGNGWGLASVAASDDGKYVAIAYLVKDEDDLYVTMSDNGGATWSAPVILASSVGGFEGRSKHIIRADRNNFYVVYPSAGQIKMRYIMNVGDLPPVAVAGGPYSGLEGGTIQVDGSASTDEGPGPGVIEYAWDWNNDGIFDDIISDSPMAEHTYTDDYQGQIVLRVKDSGGQLGYDTASVDIANVPPSVDAGNDTSCNEGDRLFFRADVTDPGSDDITYLWNFEPGSTGGDALVNHIFRDDGIYNVVVSVTDDDGGTDADSLIVTVSNVSPIADAGGPYRSPVAELITFSGSAFDPGEDDILTFQWDLDGDGTFEISNQETSRSYPDTGTYMIWLRVIDNDGGVDVDTALVLIMDDTPIITPIPDQTINEGENFSPIELDLYVEDPYQSDDQLTWQFYGNDELFVTLDNRILTPVVPDSEWTGQETLSLAVTDPKGFTDSTTVTFTVNPVNDPPIWGNLPDYTFGEDDTLEIPISSLLPLVTDVDDDPEDLWFWIAENEFIQWTMDTLEGSFDLYAPIDWYGQEDVIFVVLDSSGYSDEKSSRITVTGTPDPPYPFYLTDPLYLTYLSWPDTLHFHWEATSDPDSGSHIYYKWTMRIQGGSTTTKIRTQNVLDTTYTFIPDDELGYGTYLWWVSAYDETGLFEKSKNLGIIIVRTETDVEDIEETLPTDYNLLPNYPNPFNSTTKITYHLPENSPVRLAIYNSLGQEVRLLHDGDREGGIYTAVWDGCNQAGIRVPSGVYLCRLVAGSEVFLRKMMLVQ